MGHSVRSAFLVFALLTSVAHARTYKAIIQGDGPYAYYRLGESSGTSMFDSSATPHDGSYTSSPSLNQAGIPGAFPNTAVLFNGSSNYGSVPFDTGQIRNPGGVNRDWTAEGWFKKADTVAAHAMGNAVGAGNFNWALVVNTNQVNFITFNTLDGTYGSAPETVTINVGTYYYVVAEFTASPEKLFVYFNADAGASSTSFTGTARVGSSAFFVGRRGDTTSMFNGTIDEVAIYDKALTAAQRTSHFVAGSVAHSGAAFLVDLNEGNRLDELRRYPVTLHPILFGPRIPLQSGWFRNGNRSGE